MVGAGISGLASAWLLSRAHEVTLFEREGRLGGHAHTHSVAEGPEVRALDSGFIVYNHRTYPTFVRLLWELGVRGRPSDMSFGVRCRPCGLEYSSRGLGGLFAQKTRALSPTHLRLLADIPRFNRRARAFLAQEESDVTLGAFLDEGAYSRGFERHFILPMGAAIWSSPGRDIRRFRARSFLTFFANHGWLTLDGAPPWYTVEGGSRAYVLAIAQSFASPVRRGSAATRVTRGPGAVEIEAEREGGSFDAVVLATHADEALALLADPSDHEQRILSAFRYSKNPTVLHTDARALPGARGAWASWNCDLDDCRDLDAPVSITYHLNRLQAFVSDTQYCVSLNRTVDEASVLARMSYTHPVMDAAAVAAQKELGCLSGTRDTFFAGAHLRHGFHEDGLRSAIAVAKGLGVAW